MELDYTGHPFFDVGLSTLTAFAGKKYPRELNEQDLYKAADYMEKNYIMNPLKSFLTVAFPNSGFTQPAFEKQPEKRKIYAKKVLYAFSAPTTQERDPFTGLLAASVPYDVDGKLPTGRAFRQHVPLLTAENVINFHPYGDAGIPLSGISMLAFQAFPLGCAKVSGRLLAVHTDDADLILFFTRRFLTQNRQNVQLAQTTGSNKLPDTTTRSARTLLIDHLLEAERELNRSSTRLGPITLTAYYFSNSGQGADLQIIPLPMEVNRFLRRVQNPTYKHLWDELVRRGWQITRNDTEEPKYNRLYEDLFKLPDQAVYFIRLYFLRKPNRANEKDRKDPTLQYNTKKEMNIISWALTEIFLKEVIFMDESRIQSIRELGDGLAQFIFDRNDRRLFNDFWMAHNYNELRAALIRASTAEVRRGRKPLITLEQFLSIFEQTEGIPAADWRLGRDLVLIRMLEQLYQKGWVQQYVDEIPEPKLDDTV